MNHCPECQSKDVYKYSDHIFDYKHEFVDCNDCLCLWIKRIDTSEWIESSSLTARRYIGDHFLGKEAYKQSTCDF